MFNTQFGVGEQIAKVSAFVENLGEQLCASLVLLLVTCQEFWRNVVKDCNLESW